jgi:K+-sensing histidine kinase KdpD
LSGPFGISEGASNDDRLRLSWVAKVAFVLLMIGATLAVEWAININPRDYAYVPLLPPVLLAAVFFRFRYGILAIVICTIAADYLFALPEYDFAITEIEDAVGLSVFAVLGACLAWVIQQLLPPDHDKA